MVVSSEGCRKDRSNQTRMPVCSSKSISWPRQNMVKWTLNIRFALVLIARWKKTSLCVEGNRPGFGFWGEGPRHNNLLFDYVGGYLWNAITGRAARESGLKVALFESLLTKSVHNSKPFWERGGPMAYIHDRRIACQWQRLGCQNPEVQLRCILSRKRNTFQKRLSFQIDSSSILTQTKEKIACKTSIHK